MLAYPLVVRWRADGQQRPGVDAEVEPPQQVGAAAVGHEELAVGVAHVVGELFASAGGVDADHRRARERGSADPVQVLGDVLQQDTDVERSRTAGVGEERGPGGGFGDERAVGDRLVLEEDRGVVVIGAGSDQVAESRRHRLAHG